MVPTRFPPELVIEIPGTDQFDECVNIAIDKVSNDAAGMVVALALGNGS